MGEVGNPVLHHKREKDAKGSRKKSFFSGPATKALPPPPPTSLVATGFLVKNKCQ